MSPSQREICIKGEVANYTWPRSEFNICARGNEAFLARRHRKVPGLALFGFGVDNVHHMMQAPFKSRAAAAKYHAVLDAKVRTVKNSDRC